MYKLDDVVSFCVRLSMLDNGHNLIIVTPLTIQNLLYFIQATFWLDIDEGCFEEPMYACKAGYSILNRGEPTRWVKVSNSLKTPINPADSSRILQAMRMLKGYSALDLVDLVKHQGPWFNAISAKDSIVDFKYAADYYRRGGENDQHTFQ